jgi:hypothetical protein
MVYEIFSHAYDYRMQSFLNINPSTGVAMSGAVAPNLGGVPPWGGSEGVPGGA